MSQNQYTSPTRDCLQGVRSTIFADIFPRRHDSHSICSNLLEDSRIDLASKDGQGNREPLGVLVVIAYKSVNLHQCMCVFKRVKDAVDRSLSFSSSARTVLGVISIMSCLDSIALFGGEKLI